jgi:hypothetical protein
MFMQMQKWSKVFKLKIIHALQVWVNIGQEWDESEILQ